MNVIRVIPLIAFIIFSLSLHPIFAEQTLDSYNQPIYLGFLEYHNERSVYSPEDGLSIIDPAYFSIRVSFKATQGKWVALYHDATNVSDLESSLQYFPKRVKWNVTYKGHVIGEITSERPDSTKYYKDIGSHEVKQKSNIPTIGKPTLKYSGWIYEPVYRPLITIPKSHSIGVSSWDESVPPNEIINSAKNKFREIVSNPFNCDEGYLDTYKKYEYENDDIMIYESYVLDKTNYIISLTLSADNYFCDGLAGPDWSTHLFYINGSNELTYLGSEMFFLDAGDYDANGTPELVFWVSKYNEDGYALFYGNFSHKVEFTWHYH